jgi:hypothetical protein
LIDATIVPEPFAALTVIEGEPALRFVNAAERRALLEQPGLGADRRGSGCAGPALAFEPYVIVTVEPAASVTPETVTT